MPSPLGRQIVAQFAFQSTFGSYPSPDPTWQPVSMYSDTLNEVEGWEDDPLLGRALHNGRDAYESAPSLPRADGAYEVPMCLRELGYWLKLALGAPVTDDTDDPTFLHTFSSGATSLPYATLQSMVKASDWRRKRGVMVNTLSVRAEKGSGFPRVSLGVMGRDEAAASAALAGTVADAITLLRPVAARPVVRWEGTAIGACLAATLEYNNALERLDFVNGTEYPGDVDPGAASCMGAITMRYQDQTWVNIAKAGTPGRLEIEWAIAGSESTRFITFDMGRVKLKKKGTPFTGPGAITAEFEYRAEQTVDDPALKVILSNDVETY